MLIIKIANWIFIFTFVGIFLQGKMKLAKNVFKILLGGYVNLSLPCGNSMTAGQPFFEVNPVKIGFGTVGCLIKKPCNNSENKRQNINGSTCETSRTRPAQYFYVLPCKPIVR